MFSFLQRARRTARSTLTGTYRSPPSTWRRSSRRAALGKKKWIFPIICACYIDTHSSWNLGHNNIRYLLVEIYRYVSFVLRGPSEPLAGHPSLVLVLLVFLALNWTILSFEFLHEYLLCFLLVKINKGNGRKSTSEQCWGTGTADFRAALLLEPIF